MAGPILYGLPLESPSSSSSASASSRPIENEAVPWREPDIVSIGNSFSSSLRRHTLQPCGYNNNNYNHQLQNSPTYGYNPSQVPIARGNHYQSSSPAFSSHPPSFFTIRLRRSPSTAGSSTSRVLSLVAMIMSAALLLNIDSFIAPVILQSPTHTGDTDFRPEATTKRLLESYFNYRRNGNHSHYPLLSRYASKSKISHYSNALKAINSVLIATGLPGFNVIETFSNDSMRNGTTIIPPVKGYSLSSDSNKQKNASDIYPKRLALDENNNNNDEWLLRNSQAGKFDDSHHNNDGGLLSSSEFIDTTHDDGDDDISHATTSYSFTLSGRYMTIALPMPIDNVTTERHASFLADWERGIMIDEGKVRAVLLTRQSAISTVRLASVRIEFESTRISGKSRHTINMLGLDLRDVSALTFQGVAPSSVFGFPTVLSTARSKFFPSLGTDREQCSLLATLTFNRFTSSSGRSARPIELSHDGIGDGWGFDEAVFAEGGTWERLLEQQQQSQHGFNTSSNSLDNETSFLKRIFNDYRSLLGFTDGANNSQQMVAKSSTTTTTTTVSTSVTITSPALTRQQLVSNEMNPFKGVVVSPDCGIRIVISANEVDLVALGTRVVHFACFFVLKSLLEVRCFLAQVRYTDAAASSPLKVSVLSLGLHTCVDCFEAILLLTEAVSANFMTSTFAILAIFKIMFVSVVELRYLVIILRARYADTSINQDLPRLVKLHALGTAFMLIITLKVMPIFPGAVTILFLFWVPQIVFDAWKGHRRSLSLLYVMGVSICRLFLPLYLWGYPTPIFDGVIFKSLPGAPSWWLAVLIAVLVVLQVIAVTAQYSFGPRCFVPLILLPNVYNYYRPIPNVADTEKDGRGCFECVICMTDISYVSKTLVTTPCDHRFHETCLQQWMDVKPECPTCRGPLPPFP